MENQKSLLFGSNIFAKAFQEFDENSFFDQLEERVKPQSYFHKYKGFKAVISALSYLFNVVSAFTASYLIFWLTKWLTGIVIVAYVISAIFLFFMEQLKRKSSSEFFQAWFFQRQIALGWLALSLAVFAASVASTYYGTERATHDFAPPPPIVTQDSTLNSLYVQLSSTEKQIDEARETRWAGTTTSESQRTIETLTVQKTGLLSSIAARENGKDKNNSNITHSHQTEIKLTATTLAWLTVLFEVLFECCIAYVWYYYHRSYIERKRVVPISPISSSKTLPTEIGGTLEEQEKMLFELFKQLLNAAKQNEQEILNGQPKVENSNGFKLPVGYYTNKQRQEHLKILFKQHLEPFKQDLKDNSTSSQDLFTVPHKDFKTGQIRHVNMGNIENMISIYSCRVEEARLERNEQTMLNRQEKLDYWLNKKQELLDKFINSHHNVLT